MDPVTHIASAEDATARLVGVVSEAAGAIPVPTCPDWTLHDLTTHVTFIAEFWAHLLADGRGDPRPEFPAEPGDPTPTELASWLAAAGLLVLDELRATDPVTAVWTWFDPDATAASVARRWAHETAIHAFDAESAIGAARPIPSDLAIDGIDEFFALCAGTQRTGTASGETIHLHGTDRDAEWFIRLEPDRIQVTHEHAKGDLAVRAPVSDLVLLLWGRPPLGSPEFFGDQSILDALRRELRSG